MTRPDRTMVDRPLSPAERAYLPHVKPGAPRPVIVFGKWYPSVTAAANALKCPHSTILYWLRGAKRITGRAQYA